MALTASAPMNYRIQIISSVVSDLVIATTITNVNNFVTDLNAVGAFATLNDHKGIPYVFDKNRIISAGPTDAQPSTTV